MFGMLVWVVTVVIAAKAFWWVVGAAAFVATLRWIEKTIDRALERRHESAMAVAQYNAELAARADQQHNWRMQGDPRGIYGGE